MWFFDPDVALVQQQQFSCFSKLVSLGHFPCSTFFTINNLPRPSLSLYIFQASIPTLRHVPKGARDHWAKVLSDHLLSVVEDPTDLSSWSRVFMLAKSVLASPAAGHCLHRLEILKLVGSCIQRWLAGDLVALWSKAVTKGSLSLGTHALRPHPLSRVTTSGEQSRWFRTASTVKPSRPSPLLVWQHPRLKSRRRCLRSSPSLPL